ncbi:MAG: hypothetical protein K0S15_1948 [Solirubrobacterales bacterium]|jgi:hypothetical protein|nr:hypothetical protein [Solirubrobacterales bacterium]
MTRGILRRLSGLEGPGPGGLRDATLCVTHAELNNRHGTGAVLSKILAREPALIVIYSTKLFNGESVGDLALNLPQWTQDPAEARPPVQAALAGHEVGRILAVPSGASDPLTAVVAAELAGAPLVTYLMDDQNVYSDAIPDHAMEVLLERSVLRLTISTALRSAYEEKFGCEFWLLPAVNDERLFASPAFAPAANKPPRGVIIGNVWSRDVLEDLRATVREAGLRIDWYGNAGKPFLEIDAGELARDGIELHGNLADDPLVEALRGYDYAVMPSRALSRDHEHDWLYRASLPSRLIYVMTSALLPQIVLGDPETTAARFVTAFGLGTVSPYQPEQFAEAVRRVTAPPERAAIRGRAAELSPSFAAEPVAGWIWRSAAAGRPVDDRYERLFAHAAI